MATSIVWMTLQLISTPIDGPTGGTTKFIYFWPLDRLKNCLCQLANRNIKNNISYFIIQVEMLQKVMRRQSEKFSFSSNNYIDPPTYIKYST